MMQSPRKIGSALAAFEDTINKNKEEGTLGSRSFMTGIASKAHANSHAKSKRRSSLSDMTGSSWKPPSSPSMRTPQTSKRRGSAYGGSTSAIMSSPLVGSETSQTGAPRGAKESFSGTYHSPRRTSTALKGRVDTFEATSDANKGASTPVRSQRRSSLPGASVQSIELAPLSESQDFQKDSSRSPSLGSCSDTSAETASSDPDYGYGEVEQPEEDYGYGDDDDDDDDDDEPSAQGNGYGYSPAPVGCSRALSPQRSVRRNSCIIRKDEPVEFAEDRLEGSQRMSDRDAAALAGDNGDDTDLSPPSSPHGNSWATPYTGHNVKTEAKEFENSRKKVLSRGGRMMPKKMTRNESKRALITAMSSPLKSPVKKVQRVKLAGLMVPNIDADEEDEAIIEIADPEIDPETAVEAATTIQSLARGRQGRIRHRHHWLQKQLDEADYKRESELQRIRDETEDKKMDFLERAKTRFEKTNQRQDKIGKVQEGQELIRYLRDDNSKIRATNIDKGRTNHVLKVNNARLEDSIAKGEEYHAQLKGHHTLMLRRNKNLTEADAAYEKKVNEFQAEADQRRAYGESEHNSKKSYQKAMLAAADILERGSGDEELKDLVNEYIVEVLNAHEKIKETRAADVLKAAKVSKKSTAYRYDSDSDSDSDSGSEAEMKRKKAAAKKAKKKAKSKKSSKKHSVKQNAIEPPSSPSKRSCVL